LLYIDILLSPPPTPPPSRGRKWQWHGQHLLLDGALAMTRFDGIFSPSPVLPLQGGREEKKGGREEKGVFSKRGKKFFLGKRANREMKYLKELRHIKGRIDGVLQINDPFFVQF